MRIVLAFLVFATALAAAADAKVETELRDAENAWSQAAIKADAATLKRLLGDDLRYTHTSGRIDNKEQFIQSVASGQLKYESIELEDFATNVYGNVAVVFTLRKVRTGYGANVATFHARFMRVWVKRDGRWQLVAHEATRLPDKA